MTAYVRAELLKITSVKRTWIGVGIALLLTVLMLVVSLIFFGQSIGDEPAATGITERIALVASGFGLAAIVAGVLGVQALGAEYRTGSIVPSVTAIPQRSNFILAKVLGVGVFTTGLAVVMTIVSLAVGMIGLEIQDFPLRFTDHDMARIVFGMVLLPVVYALYGLALALLVRSSSVAIAVLLVQSSFGETAVGAFAPDWIVRYMPFRAASQMLLTDPSLNPFEGLAIMGVWIFVLTLIGYLLFERRDVA